VNQAFISEACLPQNYNTTLLVL